MEQTKRAWIEIDKAHLIHNIQQFKAILPHDCLLMPAIKANAYGHGVKQIAAILQSAGVTDFCVASLAEAIELRQAGIGGQILILGSTHPLEAAQLKRYNLTQTVVDLAYAQQLNSCGVPLCVHVGIDTGMHRLGEPSDNLENIFKIWQLANLNITGVFSHLCVADSHDACDIAFTNRQIAAFNGVVDALHSKGISQFMTHLQSSYGVLNYPALHFNYARVGIALYGVLSEPGDTTVAKVQLLPVLSLKARVVCVKKLRCGESAGYGLAYTADSDRTIAVVCIGYADGVPRQLSNKGQAIVHGQIVPIIGRICMDQLLLDVTDVAETVTGDEVVLIGESGGAKITAAEVAHQAGTITNEILSRLGSRLERIVV